jgi:hypothetical protein
MQSGQPKRIGDATDVVRGAVSKTLTFKKAELLHPSML